MGIKSVMPFQVEQNTKTGCISSSLSLWKLGAWGRVIDSQTFEQLMAFDPLGVGLVLARNEQKEANAANVYGKHLCTTVLAWRNFQGQKEHMKVQNR